MTNLLASLLALPWIIVPIASALRARRSRSLDEYAPETEGATPLVSVVIPARDEAHNIERCVRSVLASAYPRLEVIAVDDHSSDGTGAILQQIATDDERLKVVVPPPLPPQWFGKQWACQAGAASSTGDIIAFFDADTRQTADLIPRAVHAMRARTADLLTIVGTQELGTFWEKLVQPQVFAIMFVRYGGTEVVNESRRASGKIANGQCIFFARGAYDAIGGHAAVHDKAAEDLAMAQLYFTTGRRTVVVLGLEQLSTRMYTSLSEVVHGWSKNLYAGGRDTVPFGAVGRMLYPVMMLVPSLSVIVPPLLLVLSLLGVLGSGVLVWSALVTSANLIWWIVIYAFLDLSPMYALLHPFGGMVLLYISLRAIVRGRNVRWKERDYVVD